MNVTWTFKNKFWSVKSISEASKMKITYLSKAKTKILTKLALPGAHLVGEEIDPLSSKRMSLSREFALKKPPKGILKWPKLLCLRNHIICLVLKIRYPRLALGDHTHNSSTPGFSLFKSYIYTFFVPRPLQKRTLLNLYHEPIDHDNGKPRDWSKEIT